MTDDSCCFQIFDQWLASEFGGLFFNCECEMIEKIIKSRYGVFGGVCTSNNGTVLVNSLKTHYRYLLSDKICKNYPENQLVFHFEDWPIVNGAFDMIILHHSLELTSNSHALLREAVRAVRSKGKLIIIGFNPFSLCHLGYYFFPKKMKLLKSNQLISVKRLIDWLKLLDCCIDNIWYGGHHLPLITNSRSTWWSLFQSRRLQKTAWGAFYIIQASPEIAAKNLINPHWIPLSTEVNESSVVRDNIR